MLKQENLLQLVEEITIICEKKRQQTKIKQGQSQI